MKYTGSETKSITDEACVADDFRRCLRKERLKYTSAETDATETDQLTRRRLEDGTLKSITCHTDESDRSVTCEDDDSDQGGDVASDTSDPKADDTDEFRRILLQSAVCRMNRYCFCVLSGYRGGYIFASALSPVVKCLLSVYL